MLMPSIRELVCLQNCFWSSWLKLRVGRGAPLGWSMEPDAPAECHTPVGAANPWVPPASWASVQSTLLFPYVESRSPG